MNTLTIVATVAFAALAPARSAQAFHHHGQFQEVADGRAEVPGSGGLYYSGSGRDLGLRCSHCHVEPPGRVRADVSFSPTLSSGRWMPGTTYDVTVAMTGENRGMSGCAPTMPNRNGIAATVVGPDGSPVGQVAPDVDSRRCGNRFPPIASDQTTAVFGDCDGVVGVQGNGSLATWRFRWQSPAAGTGEVTLWLGVVDGDCAFDSYEDDVYETQIAMPEGSSASAVDPHHPEDRRAILATRLAVLPARREDLFA